MRVLTNMENYTESEFVSSLHSAQLASFSTFINLVTREGRNTLWTAGGRETVYICGTWYMLLVAAISHKFGAQSFWSQDLQFKTLAYFFQDCASCQRISTSEQCSLSWDSSFYQTLHCIPGKSFVVGKCQVHHLSKNKLKKKLKEVDL